MLTGKKMKKIMIMIFVVNILLANEWNLKEFHLTTENDADFRTDRDYTYGSEISLLYEKKKNSYISFCIAHQMFTPNDFDKEDVDLSKERPYAGYMYLGMGLHSVDGNKLDSLNIQLGFVGPSTKMDKVQKIIHDIIGSPEPKGWEEQIGDELIIQVNYEKRWYRSINEKSDIVYYLGGNLGNASIKAAGGAFYKYGWNLKKTFSPRRIDYRGYTNIPVYGYEKKETSQSFYFDLWCEADIVARDIFLDGNTFKDSVHIDKEIFVAKGGFGFGYRYKNFTVDYLRTYSTKEFKVQNYYHSFGSLVFAYNF